MSADDRLTILFFSLFLAALVAGLVAAFVGAFAAYLNFI